MHGSETCYLAATVGDQLDADDVIVDTDRSRQLAASVKDASLLARLLVLEGNVLRRRHEARAGAVLAEAAAQLDAIGSPRAAAIARRSAGLLALEGGALPLAEAHLQRALPPLLALERRAAALAVAGLAVVAKRGGEDLRARRLASSSRALATEPGTESSVGDSAALERLLIEVGDGSFSAAPDDDLLELVGVPRS